MKRRELTHAERVLIVERPVAGETLSVIATSLDANLFTVRHWWRAYRDDGWSGLNPTPKGPPSVGALGHFNPLVKYVALRLKREHPGWGLPMLRLDMQRRPSLQGMALPKNTSLWSYLQQFGPRLLAHRRSLIQRPQAQPVRAVRPHQCWQMDFKSDEMVHGCQSLVYPFGLTDEASGAPLLRVMHEIKARGNHRGLTTRHVQADLRQAFNTWGRPDAIRMDRDPLFIGNSHFDWPGTILLWLVGLGIQPVVNRAHRPTDNAMIERAHRTWRSDVLDGAIFSQTSTLQAASEQALEDRRRYLPSRHPGCNGQPPAEAFPELLCAHHPYSASTKKGSCSTSAELMPTSQNGSGAARSIAPAKSRSPVATITSPSLSKARLSRCGSIPQPGRFLCSLADGRIVARLALVEVTLDYILDQGV